MEVEEEAGLESVSPTGQYLSNSIISLSVIAVLESEISIDDSQALSLLRDVFLPINPRFSSIMVVNKKGEKRWKKVEVNPKDHVKVPVFQAGNSTELYDDYLNEYISKIAMQQFPQDKPLWDVHVIKYPTTQAAGNLIFKLHHSLGDGFSLMGALLSCLQRADNPSIPLTFPSTKIHKAPKNNNILKVVPNFFSSIYNTFSDFCSSIVVEDDDLLPTRSGHIGVETLPVATITMPFSLDHIKRIKAKLGVTINDVISETIMLGTRLYMEVVKKESGKAHTTALVLLSTRMFRVCPRNDQT